MPDLTKAVILARGLGKRMRAAAPSISLTSDQARAASSGVKAMISFGRPFLYYVLSALADSGIRNVCLVIGPEHAEIREHYARISPRRIQITYAVQEKPHGTANALLSAERFTSGELFLTLNSDTYYLFAAFQVFLIL